jgi:hypothetical protein
VCDELLNPRQSFLTTLYVAVLDILTSVTMNFISGDPVCSIAIEVGNYRSRYIIKGTDRFVEISMYSYWLTTAGSGKLCALLQSVIDLQHLKVSLRPCCFYLQCICLFIYILTCFFTIYSWTRSVSQNMLRLIVAQLVRIVKVKKWRHFWRVFCSYRVRVSVLSVLLSSYQINFTISVGLH